MSASPLLANIFGALALSFGVGSYLLRSHRALTLAAATGVAFWSVHFAVQQFWTPCVLSALMAVRVALGVFVVGFKLRTRWALTFLAWALMGAGAWLTWQGTVSVPSTLASLWLGWAGFHLRYHALRRALLLGEVLWFTNGWVTDSWLAMTAALLSMGLNGAVIWREDRSLKG